MTSRPIEPPPPRLRSGLSAVIADIQITVVKNWERYFLLFSYHSGMSGICAHSSNFVEAVFMPFGCHFRRRNLVAERLTGVPG